jgi:hypothetical protein
MKIEVAENGQLLLGDVFEPIILRNEQGIDFAICMRDDGFEIALNDTLLDGGPIFFYRIEPDLVIKVIYPEKAPLQESVKTMQKELGKLKTENEALRGMIENGLTHDDIVIDVKSPPANANSIL